MTSKENNVSANTSERIGSLMDRLVELLQNNPDMAKAVIKAYKDLTLRYVRRMRIVPYPEYDYNSYPFMARIIVEELFAYAQEPPKKEVRMFTGDVTSEFYGGALLFDKISDLAAQGIKFNIILAKPPADQYLASWQKLMTESSGNVLVRMKPQYSDELNHLILVGEDGYRKEASHKEDDYEGEVTEFEPKRPARFAFHDRYYAQTSVLQHWKTKVDTDDVQKLPVA